ncbi:MAG: NAD-dependent epimerase/dehydratase family protein [bacterium]
MADSKKITVLIIGASSYVGARIYQDFNNSGKFNVIGTYFSHALSEIFPDLIQLDLRDKIQVERIINNIKPDIIIHVANHASGSYLKDHPDGADLNLEASNNIVNSALNNNIHKAIFISSFAAYSQSDLYGKLKAESELIFQRLPNYVIIRPSLIIGVSPNDQNDRPSDRIVKNIISNTPAIYDTSWKFELTYLPHLSEIIQRLALSNEIYNCIIPIVARGITSRYDIAQEVLSQFEKEAIPENKNAILPIQEIDFGIYKQLKLPEITYKEAIADFVKEIKKKYKV